MGGEHVKDSLFCKNVLPCLVFGGLVWFSGLGGFVCLPFCCLLLFLFVF